MVAEATTTDMWTPRPVLDHGFVCLVDYMGEDQDIAEAARVSYQKGTRKQRDDDGLVRYLQRNRHSSPSEMCDIKLHICAPIFVARQMLRHRTASVNEESARFSVMEDRFYVPAIEQLRTQSTDNKQGRGEELPEAVARTMQAQIRAQYEAQYRVYEQLLTQGLTRELARIILPVGIYTQWYQKANLHNWLHLLSLRLDPHAQYEIRCYAQAIFDILRQLFPVSIAAFEEYTLYGQHLSRTEWGIIHDLLADVEQEEVAQMAATRGLSGREQREFAAKIT